MGKSFYDYGPDELNFVPFDIETTGFKAGDEDFVTTVVLYNEGEYHIWLNTDGDTDVDVDSVRESVIEESGLENVVLYVCDSEGVLLRNVGDYLDSHTGDNTVLTAFNGETYRGDTDFDVPFLRTRCLMNGVPWIFDGYWFTDSYEVFSKLNRFDTTVPAEPSLESMKKTDVQDFVDDRGFDINYDKMLKDDIARAINNSEAVTPEMIESWAEQRGIERFDGDDAGSLKSKQLKQFIDDKSLDIRYDKLSKDELIKEIREGDYSEEMLIEWHEETGRSIGTDEMTKLDEIHATLFESNMWDDSWRQSVPFDVELFEPFDPYEDSGEAVTAHKEGEYEGLILHCFADVARTVNLTRAMTEYASQKDYQPKTL